MRRLIATQSVCFAVLLTRRANEYCRRVPVLKGFFKNSGPLPFCGFYCKESAEEPK